VNRVSRRSCCALAALGLFAVSISVVAQAAQPAKGDDKAALEALEQRFTAAFNARDATGIMKVYVPGASLVVFDVTPPRQYVGAEAYLKDWQGLFAAFPGPVKFTESDLAIETGGGSLAFGHFFGDSLLTAKDGSKVDLVCRVTHVYRKIHGHWLIVHEHVSVPVDLATGKPDLQSKP
jgi:ketosteroid isomerase-like protein